MQTAIRTDALVLLSMMGLMILAPIALALLPWKTKAAGRVAAFLLGLSAVLLVLVAVLFDEMLGASVSWLFTLGICVLGSGVGVAVWSRYRSRFALTVIVLINSFALVQHFMDLSPVKPYRRFFADIAPGMTEAEVMAVLHPEFPDGFRFPRPVRRDFAQGQMDFFLDPNQSAWNAEGIFIHLSDGRVVSKEYSRD